MGQTIQFGQKIQKNGIDRFDCAEGVTVKGVLLNFGQPWVRNIAYDKTHRRYVECVDDMEIKYNLDPTPRYYFVVASFATDVNGNILGDKEQKVTYIQMKNKSYEEFVAQSNNLANWHGFVTLTKVPLKDYSYIKATPADDNAGGFMMSQALKDRIKSMTENENFLNRTFSLIDEATGMTKEKYELFLQNQQQRDEQQEQDKQQQQDKQQEQKAIQGGNTMYVTAPQQAAPQTATPKAVPQDINVAPDDFGAPIGDGEDLPF